MAAPFDAADERVECGYCRISLLNHPVKQCPYDYEAIRHPLQPERIVGFEMTRRG